MTIFRPVFTIFFAPFRFLANLFQHKDNLLEWHFNYGSSSVQIKTKHKEQSLADDLLIAGYILFLARYFYICDDRQIQVVRNCLEQEIGNVEPKELPAKLWNIVGQTLNKMESRAIYGLFLGGIPPLGYSENEEPSRSYAKYSFLVFERSGNLTSTFHMSSGPDIAFLPLTVAILYEFVVDKLRDKNKKETLDTSITDLLNAHHQTDCRSLAALGKLPVEILASNNITTESNSFTNSRATVQRRGRLPEK